MDFLILLSVTLLLVFISLVKDRKKTFRALKKAGKRMLNIALPMALMILITGIVLTFLSEDRISEILGKGNSPITALIAGAIGSVALMPGFIAFPLGGALRENGVPFFVLSAFTSTLMMVGIVTIPVEKKYLGLKVTLWRNIAAVFISAVICLVTGILYGEFF